MLLFTEVKFSHRVYETDEKLCCVTT